MKFLEEQVYIDGLQEADLDAIMTILRQVYEKPQWPIGGAWTESLLGRELARGGGIGLFERATRSLQAFIVFRSLPEAIYDVTVLATRQEFARKGAMSYLLNQWMRRVVYPGEAWLEVHEKNWPACKLYEKLGFRQVGRRPAYYRDGSAALLYSLSLS